MTRLYGLYSKTQKQKNKKIYIYLNDKNKEVWVTEVRNINQTNNNFDDCILMGEVFKFVRSVELNSKFFNYLFGVILNYRN